MPTVKGKFCSPAADAKRAGGESCYTKSQLLVIARAYNSQYSDPIPLSGNKEQLWNAIEKKMSNCDNEWCWASQIKSHSIFGDSGGELDSAFLPPRPPGKLQWLSTADIRSKLKQFEAVHSDFIFLGPVPMDFCSLAGNEVCNLNLESAKKNGKTKIGIVFNTDPSTKGGKHWISMFIDISGNPSDWEIDYFDSFGEAPLPPELRFLITKLKEQNPAFRLNLNCRDRTSESKICTHTVKHQLDSSECGMYSINFIVERLTGKPWEELVNKIRRDELMVKLRQSYFRPPEGFSEHPY
jgi:hypothetical protein